MTEYRFYHPIEVRFADLDSLRHVNNATYFTYMEQARTMYFEHVGLWDGLDPSSMSVILAETRCEFKRAIRFGERIQVGAATVELGRKSFKMRYRIEIADGPVCAEGSGTLVAFDYEAERAVEIPPEWREKLRQFEELA